MRFVVPQCFAAPQKFKCIVGLRLGLLGFYRGALLIATEAFTGEILESLAMMVIVLAKVVRRHRRNSEPG